jgi:hypothetical protein
MTDKQRDWKQEGFDCIVSLQSMTTKEAAESVGRLLRIEAALTSMVAAYDAADEVASDDFRDAFCYRFDIETARNALASKGE